MKSDSAPDAFSAALTRRGVRAGRAAAAATTTPAPRRSSPPATATAQRRRPRRRAGRARRSASTSTTTAPATPTEPSTTTAADGKYTLTAVATDIPAHAVLAEAIADDDQRRRLRRRHARPSRSPRRPARARSSRRSRRCSLSAVDSGRAPNVAQAETDMLDKMVGVAGDVGGLTVYSDYRPNADRRHDRRAGHQARQDVRHGAAADARLPGHDGHRRASRPRTPSPRSAWPPSARCSRRSAR